MTTRDLIISAAGASAPVVTDPNFKNVSLLLTGDGATDGAQNNTFLDSSTNNFTITRNGNTTQGTFSPYGNLWSNSFHAVNATTANIPNLRTPTSSVFDMIGGGTVEMWAYLDAYGSAAAPYFGTTLIGFKGSHLSGPAYYALGITASGYLSISWDYSGSYGSSNSTTLIPTGGWTHIAWVRNSGANKFYVNGNDVTSTFPDPSGSAKWPASSGNYYTCIGAVPYLYSSYTYLGQLNGYISNLRIVKGTALYTGAFTPSTTPLTAVSGTSLLTCQSNRFIDNSSNNFTITRNGDTRVTRFSPFNPTAPYSASTIGGSGYFDGTGDYLSVPSNSAFDLSSDFTIEFWMNVNPSIAVAARVFSRGGYTTANNIGLEIITTNKSLGLRLNDTGGQPTITTSANAFDYNTWTHVAVVRSGTNVKIYSNGISVASVTNSSTANVNVPFYIGALYAYSGTEFYGYIDNFRLVKGTAVYTGNFTPPTLAPLAATGAASAACYPSTTNVNTTFTGTSLLLNFTNAGVWDAAMHNNLESVGNARIVTTVKKYNTGSMYFDGTGDYLKTLTQPNLYLGSGDFTVEGWIYQPTINTTPAANGQGQTIISFGWTYAGSNISWFIQQSASSITVNMSSTGNSWDMANPLTAAITLSANTWNHFAVVRSGSSVSIFVNGTKSSNTATTSAALFNTANPTTIGSDNGGGYAFNGYIDDLRITKGLARYTSNFTPPAQALPTQ